MKKNNIRSIRFSDEMADLIERQNGNTFTEKFENLITRCVWELPAQERKLADINEQIIEARKKLGRLSETANAYAKILKQMEYNMCKAQELIFESKEM